MADFIKIRRELREEGIALGLTGQDLITYVTSEWDKLEKTRAEERICAEKARIEDRDRAIEAAEKLKAMELEVAERLKKWTLKPGKKKGTS